MVYDTGDINYTTTDVMIGSPQTIGYKEKSFVVF